MFHKKRLLCLIMAMMMVLGACAANPTAKSTDTTAAESTTETTAAPETTEASETTQPEQIQADTITFIDGRGKEVTVNRNPQRVVCTYGSYCTLWYECGGTLAARCAFYSSYDNMPDGLEEVPVIGGDDMNISAEIVLAEEPDLVIMNATKNDLEMADLLEASGVPCIVYGYTNFEQYLDLVKIFTDLTGREDLYQIYAVDQAERVQAVRDTIGDHSVDVVLMMPMTGGPDFTAATTICGDMLVDMNCKLLQYPDGDITKEKYQFSMEKLLELDPTYILTYGGGQDQEAAVQRALDLPGFTDLTAYKEGRHRHLDVSIYMYKPNGRYAEAYEKLAAFLYPDLFDQE